MDGAVPRYQGQFDDEPKDPSLTMELLVIERTSGGTSGPWAVSAALTRTPAGPAVWVEGFQDPLFDDAEKCWEYLKEKDGGNFYSYEIGYLWIAAEGDAPAVIADIDRSLKLHGHPLGPIPESPVAPVAVVDPDDSGEDDLLPAGPPEDQYSVQVPLPVADVLTWQLAVELVRRHPADLWLIRTYPMDMYDCLTVRRIQDLESSPSIQFNRNGTHVFIDWFGDPRQAPDTIWDISWGNPLGAKDPRDWLVELERSAGLVPAHHGVPPSTPSSLVLRWISRFLTLHLGTRTRRTAWTIDRPDYERDPSFLAIPAAADWARSQRTSLSHLQVWFVGKAYTGKAEMALSSDGDLWLASGAHWVLPDQHTSGGSITDLVARTCGRRLP